MFLIGVLFSLVALAGWAAGDFYIQKVTRHIGTIKALFFIAVLGAIGLTPFVWSHVGELAVGNNLLVLILAVCVTFFAAVFDFDALHDGKLAVVEPILGLELPLVVLLSVVFRGESLSWLQFSIIAMIFLGITLAVTQKRVRWHHKMIFEKGFVFAGIGAVGMALTNFLYCVSSQDASPLLTVWFIHATIAAVCFIILARRQVIHTLFHDLKKYPVIIFIMALADNAAWLAYSSASVYIPIAIATAISETYIAVTLILGVVVNKEKFRRHQYLGAGLAIIGLITLALVSANQL